MKKTITNLIALFILATLINSAQCTPVTNETGKIENKKQNIAEQKKMVLNKLEEGLLKNYLAENPIKALFSKKTSETSKTILKKITEQEKQNKKDSEIVADLKTDIALLLKTLNPLFKQFHPFSAYLLPIAEKVLKSEIKEELKGNENFICIEFFNSNKKISETFFEKVLTDKTTIKKTCNELVAFCDTIINSFTIKEFNEILKKGIAESKKAK